VRALLREKEILLREVHHRINNNLRVMGSLLALQAGQLKNAAAAEALTENQSRVRAKALVHEDLYRSSDLASVHHTGHMRRKSYAFPVIPTCWACNFSPA
jgi:two-component sensor histidine kinase